MNKLINDHPVTSFWFFTIVVLGIFVISIPWFALDGAGRGQYFGAVVGFCALLAGAMFNAHLERNRDDRLHLRAMQSALLAVKFELRVLRIKLDNLIHDCQIVENEFIESGGEPSLGNYIPREQDWNAPVLGMHLSTVMEAMRNFHLQNSNDDVSNTYLSLERLRTEIKSMRAIASRAPRKGDFKIIRSSAEEALGY
tara:strand:+ start:92179 stop:92769 length:591 start_codon:yes stop_codon:yes gene_type:complete